MKKETGGSAFPLFDGSAHYGGMSLRDWFAGMALQGMAVAVIAAYEADQKPDVKQDEANNNIAQTAYQIADAMLAARSK